MAERKSVATAVPSAEADVAAFLEKVQVLPRQAGAGARGRLIFALDATMSRQSAWDQAQHIQAEMFNVAAALGGLDVQLVYFRGYNECRASKWAEDAAALARLMTAVQCRGGNTQIGRVLSHVLGEAKAAKVNAVIYAGDAMEESIDTLCAKAGEIGLIGVPLFMFQEGHDKATETAYREIARLTRGAYFRFDSGSAKLLRELLSAVAAYAAGGRAALEDRSQSGEGGARLLLEQLK